MEEKTNVNNEFYSNCLIQALKHKLLNWKSVEITYISPKFNDVNCPHFLWSDGNADYDFGYDGWLSWYKRFWFKGSIRKRRLGWNEWYKESKISMYRERKERGN